jgi:ankyrin repeat protein
VRRKRVHLWWIIPLLFIGTLTGAWLWFVDSLSYGNASSLHRAVINNDQQRVTRLIARGANVNAVMHGGLYPGNWGATPLHLAARHDRVEMVEQLIRAGADIDVLDKLGCSPLHAALHRGANASAQALIRGHAKTRSPAGEGRSAYALQNYGQPLRTALQTSSISTVRLLLEAGADLRSDVGDDAMAYVDGPDRLDKVQLLLERGFSVNEHASNPNQETPLHNAANSNDTAAINLLLDHGADIEAVQGGYEFTPLLAAAYWGSNDAIKSPIEHGADPKAGTESFGSPIYAAAFAGKRETVRLLLSMNLDIDLQAGRESDNATPLQMAYTNGDLEMVKLLLDAGARADAQTTDGRLPTDFRK